MLLGIPTCSITAIALSIGGSVENAFFFFWLLSTMREQSGEGGWSVRHFVLEYDVAVIYLAHISIIITLLHVCIVAFIQSSKKSKVA